MDNSTANTKIFNEAIEKWWNELTDKVKSLKASGNEVCLIALSRKMPRVFNWMKEEYLSSRNRAAEFEIIDSCEFVTEHAIPLLYRDKTLQYETIVCDDIVVSGSTLFPVVGEVYYASGKSPILSAIFRAKSFEEPEEYKGMYDASLLAKSTVVSDTTEFFEHLSANLLHCCLPLDMEYPIFHFDSSVEADVEAVVKEKFQNARQYEIIHDGGINSFNLILENETIHFFNNDFAKIRVFDNGKVSRLCTFAPNVIYQGKLREDDLFENEEYRKLWHRVKEIIWSDKPFVTTEEPENYLLDDLEEEFEVRQYRSSMVWANYLFSLSSFIRSYLKGHNVADFEGKISPDDISLFLTKEIANELVDNVNSFVKSRIVSPSIKENVELPDTTVPTYLINDYDFLKASKVMMASNLNEALKGIFDVRTELISRVEGKEYRGESDEEFSILIEDSDFNESYKSLINAVRFRFVSDYDNDSKLDLAINRWMDKEIDKGRIVPRYQYVKTQNGLTYWKRFFRATRLEATSSK